MLEYDHEIGLVIFSSLSDFTVNVPASLAQVLNGILLEVTPPYVLERIT
jgi:hypothetical protein